MPQDRESGAAASKWGFDTARRIASAIGASPLTTNSNEFRFRNSHVVIKCAASGTTSVGVTYRMLERVERIIGAFETQPGAYELYALPPQRFRAALRDSISNEGKVGLVNRSVFEREGEHVQTVRLDEETRPKDQSGSRHVDQTEHHKPKAVIWDLDGTLSDDRARAHFVEVEQGRARDWESYFDAIDQDPPIAASMEILQAMRAHGSRVVFLTGRPDYTREKTEKWLRANGLDDYDRLVMRPAGERRPAGYFKAEAVAALREEYELVCAFEDRIDVADALRLAGVPVFLYGAGMEAAAEALEVLEADQDELLEDAAAARLDEVEGGGGE